MARREATEATKEKVIRAATQCILEEGFYRASSNEIARRADVSWGVIQYHFGSREALMLAVLDRSVRELDELVHDAVIEGSTLEERIESFAELVWSFYGQQEFLAYIQVMLNLAHDPTTETQTRDAVGRNHSRMSQTLPRLLDAAIGPDLPSDHPEARAVSAFVFAALRGLAIDQDHIRALPRTPRRVGQTFAEQRARLVDALARHVRAVASQG